uniref:Actinoporin-like protein n=1 Tax=Amphilophus citrinellus TaxID=61819 RepID=A0A3Q0TC51_AMPCI
MIYGAVIEGHSSFWVRCTGIKALKHVFLISGSSDFIFSGRCDTSLPATLQPSAVGQAVFAKTPHTACGSVGVFTYDLYDESTGRADKKMAVMFSVPYDFNLYSNWHAVGVFDRDTKCDRHLYNKMYQKTQKGFVRGKAKDPGLTYKDETVTITSTMTDSYEPILELEISSTSNKVHPCHV